MSISNRIIRGALFVLVCMRVQAQDSTYPPISNIQSVQQPGGTGASTTPAVGPAPAAGATTKGGASTEPFQSGNSLKGNSALMNEYDEIEKKNASGSPNYYIDTEEDAKRKGRKEEEDRKIEAENTAERNKDVFDYWKTKKKFREQEKKEIQKEEKESNEYFESPDF